MGKYKVCRKSSRLARCHMAIYLGDVKTWIASIDRAMIN